MKKTLDLFYDKKADVLYASSGKLTKRDISEEAGDDVVIWKNKETGKLSGLTVLNFSKRESKGSEIKLPFSLEIKEQIPQGV